VVVAFWRSPPFRRQDAGSTLNTYLERVGETSHSNYFHTREAARLAAMLMSTGRSLFPGYAIQLVVRANEKLPVGNRNG
jgi:hypothetical protein